MKHETKTTPAEPTPDRSSGLAIISRTLATHGAAPGAKVLAMVTLVVLVTFFAFTEDSALASIHPNATPISAPTIDNFNLVEKQPQGTGFELGPTFANVEATIHGNGAETLYSFEYASNENGPWAPVSGAGGSIAVAEEAARPVADLEELTPEKTYYVRANATNAKGSTSSIYSFETSSNHPDIQSRPEVSEITGTSVHVQGYVYAGFEETSWRVEYASTEGGPWVLASGTGGTITVAEADKHENDGVQIEAEVTGLSPSKTYYVRLFAENSSGTSASQSTGFETGGPPLVETFATHAIHGEALRVLGAVTPDSYDTHYRFEYVAREQFEKQGGEGEFSKAQSTPELDAGSSEKGTTDVGEDIPGLEPGKTYDFRLVATNTAPGDPVVRGEVQTLTVPADLESGEAQVAACPNVQDRGGLSGLLPDCRAYEQITPIDKRGALEPFTALSAVTNIGYLFSEDGDHFMLEASRTNWGSGQSPYFFARTGAGWQMTAATTPEAGVNQYKEPIANPELTMLGFDSASATGGAESADEQLELGAPGGPYTTVASVPSSSRTRWVDATEDFHHLVLQTEDRTLVSGRPSSTHSGYDLYEYFEGALRQVNVSTEGTTIGSCGAEIVHGTGEATANGLTSTRHAISTDGSRILFEAVPGGSCSEPTQLYMRVGGTKTIDIGAYAFLAANPTATTLLLEKNSGEDHEIILYDIETAAAKPLFSVPGSIDGGAADIRISEEFNVIYLMTTARLPKTDAPPGGGLYRYDIGTETLSFVVPGGAIGTVSPSGRYDYFTQSTVGGVPGGGLELGQATPVIAQQLFRYDSVENTVECVSCASPFDSEPKLGLENSGGLSYAHPEVAASANGDYAFFETPAALVPQDLNGEIPPPRGSLNLILEGESPSWDVYEWRRAGLDGCVHFQGCISLITPGVNGVQVGLLGTTPTGDDVFITTHSSLLPQDNDTAQDIYDARIDGGFATQPGPVECEGDTCSTPASPPDDVTPSSFTFMGAEDLVQPGSKLTRPKATNKKAARCVKGNKCIRKDRRSGRHKKKARATSHKGGRRG